MMATFGMLTLAMITPPAQDTTDYDYERFQLFSNCEPMHLLFLSSLDNEEDAKKLGLTDERVQFAVESRLRGAGFSSQASACLSWK